MLRQLKIFILEFNVILSDCHDMYHQLVIAHDAVLGLWAIAS